MNVPTISTMPPRVTASPPTPREGPRPTGDGPGPLTRRCHGSWNHAHWRLPILVGAMTMLGAAAAEWSAPGLVTGNPQPADHAPPLPPATIVNAVSDDGQKLLLTSASDRLATKDDNQAADVFVFDRAQTVLSMVSTRAGSSVSANGTSLGADFADGASKVLFLSRAGDLLAGDTNETWDVFLRDLATGETRRVSVFPEKDPGATPFLMPQISRDGRMVLFESTMTNLDGRAGFPGKNLFVRDLTESATELVSTEWPEALEPVTQAQWARLAADGRSVVFVGNGLPLPRYTGLIRQWKTGTTVPINPDTGPVELPLSPIDFSADGGLAVYQAVIAIQPLPQFYTNAVFLRDVVRGTTTIIAQTTNAFASATPLTALAPVISSGSEAAAFCLPLGGIVTNDFGKPFVPAQLLHYDRASQTTTLVSTAHDTDKPISADALYPRISANGRFVACLSRATNLVTGYSESRWRVYWWDRETGKNHVLLEVPEDSPISVDQCLPVFSPNGQWLAVGVPAAFGEPPAVTVVSLPDGSPEIIPLPSAHAESRTGPGWLTINPNSVSADGRYVAFTAPAADLPGHVQVWLLDTQTGARELLSVGEDGSPGNANSTAPSISADGTKAAFASFATNLTAETIDGAFDAVLRNRVDGDTTLLGSVTVGRPVSGWRSLLLSPDGRYVASVDYKGGPDVLTIWESATATAMRTLRGHWFNPRSFSAPGTRLATISRTLGWWTGAIKVLDVPVYQLTGGRSGLLLEQSAPLGSSAFALSRDGNRIAFPRPNPAVPRGTDLVVVEVDTGQDVFVRDVTKTLVPEVVLSDDGTRLAWLQPPGFVGSPFQQVWWADLATGVVTLGSVAADGESPANGNSRHVDLSGDGHYLTFACLGDNLTPGDTNHAKDVFLRDLETGETLLVSRTADGAAGNRWSTHPFFSANGRCLFFLSHASNLVANDLNERADLFKVELLEAPLLAVIQRNLTSDGARLLWNGEVGKSYRVEFTGDLGTPDWQTAPGDIGPGFSFEITTDLAHGFYRVAELP